MQAVALRAQGAFARRHIGPSPEDQGRMLASIGVASLDALIDEVVPSRIRLRTPLDVPGPEEEHVFLTRLTQLASRNRVFRSYIGLGYHDTITPSVDPADGDGEPRLVHAVHARTRRRSRRAGSSRSSTSRRS